MAKRYKLNYKLIYKNQKKMSKRITNTDEILHLIDRILRNNGKTNFVHKDAIVELRNNVVDLQIEADEKENKRSNK